jgi:hypothetical protein
MALLTIGANFPMQLRKRQKDLKRFFSTRLGKRQLTPKLVESCPHQ